MIPGGCIACIYKGHLDIRMHTECRTYTSFESLIVKLMIKSKLHWISTIYRPPYSNKHPIPTTTFIDEFPDHVSHLLCQTDNPIIVGDINIPWNKTDNLDTISLTEILELYNLNQHVGFPTHKQGNTIDWVMNVRDTDDFIDLHTSEFLSDHCTIEWQMNIKRPDTIRERSMIRNLKTINREEFARDLDEELNKSTHEGQPLQELYDGFVSSIETTLDKHAPLRESIKTVRNNQPWFDEDAKKLKLQRRLAEKHWLKSRTAADKTHYMHINKCYLRHLYQSKKSYINKQLECYNNNSQMLFRILNQLTKGQHDNPHPDFSSCKDLANKFADFFIGKIEKIRSQFHQARSYTPPSRKCKNMTQFRPMSEEEILKILNNMKKTTCDVDPCNMNFLMEFRDVLLGTWTKIINKSLLSGHYLQSWKKAIIRPLIKSSKLQRELKNYRPISNLSFISKSIEKAALLQFSTFFEDQNLLPTYQSAYRKHHSTETAVLNICDEILENAEHNKLTAMVCLDLSAAFDTVNHSILKYVMEHYFGLKDTALKWLSSYISNRQFSVKIGSSLSHAHTINFSVPQGSILGPVLFSCYVSTLPEVIKQNSDTIILGYADDHAFTQAFTLKDTLVNQIIEEKVDRIKSWMSMNHLQMNDTKTEFITFGTAHLLNKKTLDSITFGDTTVKSSKTIKFLGVLLDDTLSFKQHVAARAKSALYGIHLIKNVRKYLTMATTKMLMCTMVLSQLDYINSILTNTSLITTRPYQKIQNQAARIIYKKTKWTSATSFMKQLHWLPIRYRCRFKLLTIVYKTLHGNGPAYLRNRLKIKNNTRGTRMTSCSTLYLEVPFNKRRTVADRGFSYMAAQHWNVLPNHIKTANNLQQFKKLLKTYFFNIVYN